MKKTQKATSIIEAIVIMLIIVTGVVGMYNIYTESVRLSAVTAQRLQAIQIAREGVEAMENIRNTNWAIYAADYKNCWNTLNYNRDCRGDNANANGTDISIGSYTVYQKPNLRWELAKVNRVPSDFLSYLGEFEVFKDDNGMYTQTGSFSADGTRFTREIQISYLETNFDGSINSDDEKMRINSKVRWRSRGDKIHDIEIESILTNWKNDN